MYALQYQVFPIFSRKFPYDDYISFALRRYLFARQLRQIRDCDWLIITCEHCLITAVIIDFSFLSLVFQYLVCLMGFEPMTPRLKVACSANWATDTWTDQEGIEPSSSGRQPGIITTILQIHKAPVRLRTGNLLITNQMHCQLCYRSMNTSDGCWPRYLRRDRAVTLLFVLGSIKCAREDSNLRCFFVADLQSAAVASEPPTHKLVRRDSNPQRPG